MKLHLADHLSLPIDAATQTFACIGRKGSGKTYAAGKLVELLIGAGVQVGILDTVGNWYGLRLAADGKAPGLDVPIFGGLRGDVPLEPTGGALMADILADSGRSMVLDLSQFSKADRQRFAAALGIQLWKRKKGERQPSPLHLVLEESQLIVPENVRGDAATMVGTYEEIIRLGRNYGIGVTMITQRPQSVNKEVLNQTECLLVFQVSGAHERKALKDWIVAQGADVNLVNELPGLKPGDCYVWSPQWLDIFRKVRIEKKETFDSTSTPTVGGGGSRREIKPIDLQELQARMAETIERAKAEDPRELRKQIAELKKRLAARPAPSSSPIVRTVEVPVPVLKDGQLKRTEALAGRLDKFSEQLITSLQDLRASISPATSPPRRSDPAASSPSMVRTSPPAAAMVDRHAGPSRHPRRDQLPPASSTIAPGEATSVQKRILNALAELEVLGVHQADRVQVAFLAGYSNPRSKGFANSIGSLHSAGQVTYPTSGTVALSEAGRAQADPPARPPTTAELQERVIRLVGGAGGRILRELIAIFPEAMDRDVLGERTGYTNPRSKGFANSLGRLRSLGFVEYPAQGIVSAAAILFLGA